MQTDVISCTGQFTVRVLAVRFKCECWSRPRLNRLLEDRRVILGWKNESETPGVWTSLGSQGTKRVHAQKFKGRLDSRQVPAGCSYRGIARFAGEYRSEGGDLGLSRRRTTRWELLVFSDVLRVRMGPGKFQSVSTGLSLNMSDKRPGRRVSK